jgi:hypothetical protein
LLDLPERLPGVLGLHISDILVITRQNFRFIRFNDMFGDYLLVIGGQPGILRLLNLIHLNVICVGGVVAWNSLGGVVEPASIGAMIVTMPTLAPQVINARPRNAVSTRGVLSILGIFIS